MPSLPFVNVVDGNRPELLFRELLDGVQHDPAPLPSLRRHNESVSERFLEIIVAKSEQSLSTGLCYAGSVAMQGSRSDRGWCSHLEPAGEAPVAALS